MEVPMSHGSNPELPVLSDNRQDSSGFCTKCTRILLLKAQILLALVLNITLGLVVFCDFDVHSGIDPAPIVLLSVGMSLAMLVYFVVLCVLLCCDNRLSSV